MNLNAEPITVAEGFEFCEGPAFAPDGSLWVVNLAGGYISKVNVDTGEKAVVARTQSPNGGQFHPNGHYIVCECKERAIISVSPTGEITVLAEQCDGQPFNGPNDVTIAADGSMYFTDPDGSDLDNRIGGMYLIKPDQTVVRVDLGLAYPNGLNLTATGKSVVLAETLTKQLHRYDRNADGTLGPRQLYCQLPDEGVGPDGMAFDCDGVLFATHYGSACVRVVDPAGKHIGDLRLPGHNPTNCCFGPPGSKWERSLFVTETETNTVYRFDVDTPGLPLPVKVG